MQVLRETLRSLRATPVFAFYVLVTLAVAGYIGLMVGQMALGLDFFLPGLFGQMTHGAVESHRVHDLTYGSLIATGVVGVLAQLRRPSKNVAGMVMALIPFVGLVLAAVLSDEFEMVVRRTPFRLVAAVTAVAALVHPAGRRFFRSFRVSRINWVMLALVGVAAVPLLSFASTNIQLQGTVRDDHYFQGHYAFMAAFGFTVIGVGLLATLRPDGWRLTAWVAGVLPALVGASSLLYPDASSSLDLGWALAAIAWGVVFVAAAELTKHVEGSTLLGSPRVGKVSAPEHPERAAPQPTHAR
ncbi:MAG: hypothetical protein M3450_00395 [Actinomycetota bacterium]|nr:hypothetical protein [Actinomycetota bacterium]